MSTAINKESNKSILVAYRQLVDETAAFLASSKILHGVAIAFSVMAFTEQRNTTPALYLLACIAECWWYFRGSTSAMYLSAILIVLSLASPFFPFNVNVRYGSVFAVRSVPIVYDLGARNHIREMEHAGLREDKDFIVISNSPPIFTFLRKSLVMYLPSK